MNITNLQRFWRLSITWSWISCLSQCRRYWKCQLTDGGIDRILGISNNLMRLYCICLLLVGHKLKKCSNSCYLLRRLAQEIGSSILPCFCSIGLAWSFHRMKAKMRNSPHHFWTFSLRTKLEKYSQQRFCQINLRLWPAFFRHYRKFNEICLRWSHSMML